MHCLFGSVLRDIEERGRDLEQVLTQYITFVKPAFEEFCLPVSVLLLPVFYVTSLSVCSIHLTLTITILLLLVSCFPQLLYM